MMTQNMVTLVNDLPVTDEFSTENKSAVDAVVGKHCLKVQTANLDDCMSDLSTSTPTLFEPISPHPFG